MAKFQSIEELKGYLQGWEFKRLEVMERAMAEGTLSDDVARQLAMLGQTIASVRECIAFAEKI